MGPSATELRTIPLFQGFGDEELGQLGGLFTTVTTSIQQKPLFDVGEPATELYLLTAGEVVLERPDDDLFRLSPPALIGELGALTGLPRSTRAMVTDGSTVWGLPREDDPGLLREAPGARRAVPRQPARRRRRQGPPRSDAGWATCART